MGAAPGSRRSSQTRLSLRRAPGVCAALLIRNDIPVLSQRDQRTLGYVIHKLDASAPLDPAARDHHETDWYVARFRA